MNGKQSFLATRSAYSDWTTPAVELAYGQGPWLYAKNGRRYLDFASGSGSLIFGHGDKGAIAALNEQLGRYSVYPAAEFRSPHIEEYLDELVIFAGGNYRKAMLSSSGSDAVESACKLALHYHYSRGDSARRHIVGREASYHGNSLFGLEVGGFTRRRAPYTKVLREVPKAAAAFCYRCTFAKTPDSCQLDCAASVEAAFMVLDPRTVAAFIMEPIVGAALSAGVPDDRYYARVRQLCDQYGVLLIADEVMTGFGRTGRALASEHWQVQPDIAIVGKAMSGGYFPLSGIFLTEQVAEPLMDNRAYFENGQTHLFSSSGAAVGSYVLERIRSDGLIERSRCVGERLRKRLEPLLHLPVVGDVRGVGLMIGIELVQQQTTRKAFPVTQGISRRFARLSTEQGLIIYPSGGGAQTSEGDHVLLLPPLNIDEKESEFAADCLFRAAAELNEQIAGESRAPTTIHCGS